MGIVGPVTTLTGDAAQAARRTPDPARDTYNSDEWLVRTCL
ncbi:hypothetical protein [Streptomyces phaeochromogenes]